MLKKSVEKRILEIEIFANRVTFSKRSSRTQVPLALFHSGIEACRKIVSVEWCLCIASAIA